MKVVILAGGLGTRMREETEFRPKPMVEVGGKPVLWHLMKIFAHFGHTDFVVCVGYKGDQIKDYFLRYRERNMDFTCELGDPGKLTFHGVHDESDWRVTVVDTGSLTPTGGRVANVEKHIGDETFFCTYGDGLAPVDLASLLDFHREATITGTVTVTRPPSRFGLVERNESGGVTGFLEKPKSDSYVSMGFFLFEPEIFGFLSENSDLERDVLPELARRGRLRSFVHEGFWQPMDTQRELSMLQELWHRESAPWGIWLGEQDQ